MVRLTRLDGQKIVINADVIESVMSAPDTVIRLTSGTKIVVMESVDEVVDRIAAWKRRTLRGCPSRRMRAAALLRG